MAGKIEDKIAELANLQSRIVTAFRISKVDSLYIASAVQLSMSYEKGIELSKHDNQVEETKDTQTKPTKKKASK